MGWGEFKPSIFSTLHPNTSLGYSDDSICGKLHGILFFFFLPKNAIIKLRVLDWNQKSVFMRQLCHTPSCVPSGKSLNFSELLFLIWKMGSESPLVSVFLLLMILWSSALPVTYIFKSSVCFCRRHPFVYFRGIWNWKERFIMESRWSCWDYGDFVINGSLEHFQLILHHPRCGFNFVT